MITITQRLSKRLSGKTKRIYTFDTTQEVIDYYGGRARDWFEDICGIDYPLKEITFDHVITYLRDDHTKITIK